MTRQVGVLTGGGSPTAFDRILATRFGVAAIALVHQGEFGKMTALRGNQIVAAPLAEAARPVPLTVYPCVIQLSF